MGQRERRIPNLISCEGELDKMLAWGKKVCKGCWLFSTQGMRKSDRAGEGNVSSCERDSYKGGHLSRQTLLSPQSFKI